MLKQKGCCQMYFPQKQPQEVFCKKAVLENFAKFTGKHLYQTIFFNKLADRRPEACNSIKKRIWHRCFPVNFVKLLRTLFSLEKLWWLLLCGSHACMHIWNNDRSS